MKLHCMLASTALTARVAAMPAQAAAMRKPQMSGESAGQDASACQKNSVTMNVGTAMISDNAGRRTTHRAVPGHTAPSRKYGRKRVGYHVAAARGTQVRCQKSNTEAGTS